MLDKIKSSRWDWSVAWVVLRCVDRISKKTKKKILEEIPNRIKFLDKLNFNTAPMVCK